MTHNELVAACDRTFGSISEFLVRYCGFKHPERGRQGGKETPLVCPHHSSEKNSLGGNCSANNAKAVFTCYTCCAAGEPATGSYVDAVKLYLHMSDKEALDWLSEKCGLKTGSASGDARPSISSIRRAYVEICHDILWKYRDKREVQEAFTYLHGRGFTDQTIRSYRIGRGASSPSGLAIRKLLEKYTKDDLLRAGVLRVSKRGNIYSPFQNRVILMAGENIYGRSLLPSTSEKLPHLYSRGENHIFNEGAVRDGLDAIFVVESIFDALTVQQYIAATSMHWGVIATLGTHGVPDEGIAAFLKKKKPHEVIIIPDCDPWMRNGHRHAAGQMAGIKRAKVFENAGLAVRLMNLPEGMDANDLGKSNIPPEVFIKLVQKALPTILFRIGCTSKYFDLDKIGGRQGFLNSVEAEFRDGGAMLPDEAIHFVSLLTKMPEEELHKFFDHSIRFGNAKAAVRELLALGVPPEEIVKELAS